VNKPAFILLFLIVSVSCKDLVTYASFLINQDFIATTFCINRDEPIMQCHGKCHLTKLIKENQEEQKDTPNTVKEKEATVIFLSEICKILIVNNSKKRQRQPVFFRNHIFSSSYLKEIFHPPQFAA